MNDSMYSSVSNSDGYSRIPMEGTVRATTESIDLRVRLAQYAKNTAFANSIITKKNHDPASLSSSVTRLYPFFRHCLNDNTPGAYIRNYVSTSCAFVLHL